MKNRILLLLALGFCITANAQYKRAGGGAFSFGVQTLSTAGLHQFYTGAPNLSNANFSFGGYGYAQFNDWLFGFSGAGVYGEEIEDAQYIYFFGGGYFTLDFGYKLINKAKWSLYPMANFGVGGVGYSITQKTEIATGGGEMVTFNNAEYNWGNMIFGAGLRFERYFKLKDECDGGKSAGLFGVEVGYMNSPRDADWLAGSRTFITGGPDFSFESFFVRLTLGGFASK